MAQKINFPITTSDFERWGKSITRNNDTICDYCEGELETKEEFPFSAGIYYKCKQCGKEFRKRKYMDFGIGESYFVLEKKGSKIKNSLLFF